MKKRYTVLIVDDDQSFANSLRDILAQRHPEWEIHPAYDASSAIEFVNQNPVDAVLVDWKLDEHNPKVRGDSVIKAVRTRDPLCGILLVSGLLDEVQDIYGPTSDYVPDDYIPKTKQGRQLAKELSFKLTLMLKRVEAHRGASYSRHIDSKLKPHYRSYIEEARLSSRWITAVFTDIRGFSTVAHDVKDQSQLVLEPFLKRLYQMIVKRTHEHSGIVDKFMGDGAMLLFGALGESNGAEEAPHAFDALKAAIAIRSDWRELFKDFSTKAKKAGARPAYINKLDLGIGIHTAEVLIGVIKTEERDQFTAIGHGINKAKRFESFAGRRIGDDRWGSILLSSTTEEWVKEGFTLEAQPNFSAKGTDPEEPCWKVVEPQQGI